jgi:predicted phosphoribosyltransferase
MFQNRTDAGIQLAKKLEGYIGAQGVLLAVPGGGVPVGYAVSKKTGLPLDLLMTMNIGHPQNREFAIGAVGLADSYFAPYNGISKHYIKLETERIRKRLAEIQTKFTGSFRHHSLKDTTVIVIDDGLASGNNLTGSINMLRKEGVAKIVLAVPVASRLAASRLQGVVDELIYVQMPDEFQGVEGFYKDYHRIRDQEMFEYLDKCSEESLPL